MIHNTKYKIHHTGFTVIFAVISMGILLVIGLAVSDVILKELILSSVGSESQKAFYAADTGIECALYWDIKRDIFKPGENINFYCNNQIVGVGGSLISNFEFNFENGSCTSVIVDKSSSPNLIEARGYNVDCGASNLKKVERGLRVTY